jgi:DtxR family Mn-dependent transcriptional regulator
MSPSLENYLKIVGMLSDKGNVRVTDIALSLGVSKPSVFTALKTLEKKGMVEHKRYSFVILTKEGKRRSDEIRNRNTALLAFLQEILGVSGEAAEKDACKMEHILSDETFKKLGVFGEKHGKSKIFQPLICLYT